MRPGYLPGRTPRFGIGLGMPILPRVPVMFAPALLPDLDNPWAERYVYASSAGFALTPGFFEGHHRLAVALAVQGGRHAEALARVVRAVELDPRSARAHGMLGLALSEAGRISEAAAFRRALTLDPSGARSRANPATAERLLSAAPTGP